MKVTDNANGATKQTRGINAPDVTRYSGNSHPKEKNIMVIASLQFGWNRICLRSGVPSGGEIGYQSYNAERNISAGFEHTKLSVYLVQRMLEWELSNLVSFQGV